jgi:hypothetical protein
MIFNFIIPKQYFSSTPKHLYLVFGGLVILICFFVIFFYKNKDQDCQDDVILLLVQDSSMAFLLESPCYTYIPVMLIFSDNTILVRTSYENVNTLNFISPLNQHGVECYKFFRLPDEIVLFFIQSLRTEFNIVENKNIDIGFYSVDSVSFQLVFLSDYRLVVRMPFNIQSKNNKHYNDEIIIDAENSKTCYEMKKAEYMKHCYNVYSKLLEFCQYHIENAEVVEVSFISSSNRSIDRIMITHKTGLTVIKNLPDLSPISSYDFKR